MPHAFIRCLKFRFGSLAILVSLAVSVNGAAGTVEQWGVFDIPLSGSTNGNPFVDVQFSARFSFSTSTVEVVGFYDGDGIYRVRFMPDKPGHWRYTTHSNRPELDVKTGEFVVTSPTGSNHGPVQVANTYHFAYGDGSPFRPIGTTSYNWAHMADALEEQTLASLAAARSLASFLYGVSTSDLLTFSATLTMLTVVALVACAIPARRAMRVNPIVALRYE